MSATEVRTVQELDDAGFWNNISDGASPASVISEQVKLLRKFCLHSEWIGFCNPFAATSEVDFTIALLKAIITKPAGFTKTNVEFHFAKRDVEPIERARLQNRAASFIRSQVTAYPSAPNTVNVFCWPRMLERTIFAGTYTKDGDGNTRKKPRWGISMTHVAHGEAERQEHHRWRLLEKGELGFPFDAFLSERAANKPVPTSVWQR